MPRLRIDKQERYATYLANGYTQVAAYAAAGYSARKQAAAANASKLASDPDVKERVEELKIKAAESQAMSGAPPLPLKKKPTGEEIDLEWINKEYIYLLNVAKTNEDLKNATIILKELSELNKIGPPKEKEDDSKNRMLPTYERAFNMGPAINISLIDSKSQEDGRIPVGPFAIEIPDSVELSQDDNSVDEDTGS